MKKLNLQGRILTKSPNYYFLRGQYFNLKCRYKATCKKEKRKLERKLVQHLANLYTKILESVKTNQVTSGNKLPEHQTFLSLNDLYNHYKSLMNLKLNQLTP